MRISSRLFIIVLLLYFFKYCGEENGGRLKEGAEVQLSYRNIARVIDNGDLNRLYNYLTLATKRNLAHILRVQKELKGLIDNYYPEDLRKGIKIRWEETLGSKDPQQLFEKHCIKVNCIGDLREKVGRIAKIEKISDEYVKITSIRGGEFYFRKEKEHWFLANFEKEIGKEILYFERDLKAVKGIVGGIKKLREPIEENTNE